MTEDLSKVVTMRTPETEQRYREAMIKRRAEGFVGCAICIIPDDPSFPDLQHWRVVPNEYPYDKVAQKSWIMLPRRCVSLWALLTPDEQREYHEFRLIAGQYGVNFFMWSTPVTQSVPGHYHEHLLRLYRAP